MQSQLSWRQWAGLAVMPGIGSAFALADWVQDGFALRALSSAVLGLSATVGLTLHAARVRQADLATRGNAERRSG